VVLRIGAPKHTYPVVIATERCGQMNSELVEPRLVKVRAGRRGSGWAIGQRGVLTARHVVQDFLAHQAEACLAVPDPAPGTAVFGCTVSWEDAVRDLAVLQIRAEQVQAWDTAIGQRPAPVLAKPGTDKVDATAVGYPAVAIDSDWPQPEQVPGTLLPTGGAVSGRMPFDVDTSLPDTADLWKGISGAVLRDRHGRLLGVVIEADNKRQQRRLYVSALPDPECDPKFAAALISVGAVPVLEAADAPHARELLALLDEPVGRPYTAITVPNLGELGTRESRTDIDTHGNAYYPYIARTVDTDLVNAIDRRVSGQDDRLLLVVGEPMTGKSRTLAEAIQRHMTVSRMDLLVPHGQCDLRQLARFVPVTGALLWLDDLIERVTALDRGLMQSLLRIPHLIKVGSLRTDELRLLQDKPNMRSAWKVLDDRSLVEQVELKERWTEKEQQGLSYAEPFIRERVEERPPPGGDTRCR
jgi:Trypsin-like peptidase domain